MKLKQALGTLTNNKYAGTDYPPSNKATNCYTERLKRRPPRPFRRRPFRLWLKRKKNFLYGPLQKKKFGVFFQYTMVKRSFGRRSIDQYGKINFRGATELTAKQHRASTKLIKRARSTNVLLPRSVRIKTLFRRYRFFEPTIPGKPKPKKSYRVRRRLKYKKYRRETRLQKSAAKWKKRLALRRRARRKERRKNNNVLVFRRFWTATRPYLQVYMKMKGRKKIYLKWRFNLILLLLARAQFQQKNFPFRTSPRDLQMVSYIV